MRHISRLTLRIVSGLIAVAIAACGTVYQPPAEGSVYIGVTTFNIPSATSEAGSATRATRSMDSFHICFTALGRAPLRRRGR